ncbi:phage tail assembly protein [Noviherbaspirillum cavernae]|uniref:Phage tail assembly protein n=1 Tax=Noviherbaspirillum cavernae TaxID=2320862 RepID=A0A418X1D6_9BURK|nr:phage tail assembly protein [Noviherbaspirillum cavernae]RJG06246.1 phage tail assembly protein [Noviherbaspirillum cavernae]
MKIRLSKPIIAHGAEVSELDLADPTSEDVMELGYPYLVVPSDTDDTGIELRPKVVGRYVSRLAKIPMSSVKQMAIADLQQMQGVVMGFFGVSEEGKISSKSASSN